MAGQNELELFKIMHDSRQKYVYFLLAAVGACIGFAITQTRDAPLTLSAIPLGVAVTCWALSFFFGCRYLHKRSVTVGTNIELYRLRSGTHPLAGRDPGKIAIGIDVMEGDFKSTNDQVGFAYRWQFRFFIVASLAFLSWHVFEMYQRTIT